MDFWSICQPNSSWSSGLSGIGTPPLSMLARNIDCFARAATLAGLSMEGRDWTNVGYV